MKTLLTTAILSSAIFASQAFAGGLSDFSSQSVETNLAVGSVVTEQGFLATNSPLSNLGSSTEAHFGNGNNSNVNQTYSNDVVSFGLVAPAHSTGA